MQETTIRLTKQTRDKLASLGSKDETFDDIVNRLMVERNE